LDVEKIDYEYINFSKNMFFYSEHFLRKIKSNNVPVDVINDTFAKCHSQYLKIRVSQFRKDNNSQNFVEKVVEDISNKDFKKLNKYITPQEPQKAGLIHILANDENRDIKWGDKDV
jgi:hypothetical protein